MGNVVWAVGSDHTHLLFIPSLPERIKSNKNFNIGLARFVSRQYNYNSISLCENENPQKMLFADCIPFSVSIPRYNKKYKLAQSAQIFSGSTFAHLPKTLPPPLIFELSE